MYNLFFFTVPDAPNVKCIPHYHHNGSLISIDVKINKMVCILLTDLMIAISFQGYAILQEHFNVTEHVDGSPISYTVTITDTTSGIPCGSAIIKASSCVDGLCNYVYEVISLPCPPSNSISVAVYATNIFGDGVPSSPYIAGTFFDYSRT